MYEHVLQRYQKGYVREDQLERYVALGVLTREQAQTIRASKEIGRNEVDF